MRSFLGFYKAVFALMFVICVLGSGCSDDSEKPKVESDIGVDASVDVDSDVDSSLGDVQEVEDVAQDASSNDAGGKTAMGEACPDECVVSGGGGVRCSECGVDYWCYLDDFERYGKPAYCTSLCVRNADCEVYGVEWSCDTGPGICVKE